LKYYLPDREPHSLHRYIWSTDIECALKKVEEPCLSLEQINGDMIIHSHRKQPMSEEDVALRDRLLARLELSREYERQMEKVDGQLGLARLNKKLENRVWPRLNDLERRIYSAPAVTQSDLNIKLALYDKDEPCAWTAERLFRDFRRVVKLAPLPAEAVKS
jgi:hypothetical protein